MLKHSQKEKIKALQHKIHNRFNQEVLHILNGQMMYEDLYTHQLMDYGDYIPFNEAMCSNETCYPVFDDAFKQLRASGHDVSLKEYESITITPLKPLFENKYKCIVLWFGHDMFCQMNMLTVLTFLEQVGYKGELIFHKVQERTYEVEESEILPLNYKDLYQQVLIHHRLPEVRLTSALNNGVELYLEYVKDENEIIAYIKKYIDLSQDELLCRLFNMFPQYGLGDIQYLQIIKTIAKA
ncbi:AraC family transcriptional regulator [Bacillus sp. JJ722]|uniref:AraC family transcriptional regulator n=1 Tax=Bacillus sp. JJ722 TaxID=3122973 RepID=UPI002FFF2519